MKNINTLFKAFAVMLLMITNYATAQTEMPEMRLTDLTKLQISNGVSLHIISPEPIQFVDLSTDNLVGDLPADNIARVKIIQPASDSLKTHKTINFGELGIVTIVAQSFMAQYKLNWSENNPVTNIQIQPEDMQPLDFPKMKYSKLELQKFSNDILRQKKIKTPIREEKDFQLKMKLNNVYVQNDYIFLDMSFENMSNLSYSIDGIKFSVDDKKIYKSTNNQSIDLEPVFKLYNQKDFRKQFRNIYVFKKFTYPNSKVLRIRLLEEQLSGRTLEMQVKYSDILNADTF